MSTSRTICQIVQMKFQNVMLWISCYMYILIWTTNFFFCFYTLSFILCNFFSLIYCFYIFPYCIFFHTKIPMTSIVGFKTNLPSCFFSLNRRRKNFVLIWNLEDWWACVQAMVQSMVIQCVIKLFSVYLILQAMQGWDWT